MYAHMRADAKQTNRLLSIAKLRVRIHVLLTYVATTTTMRTQIQLMMYALISTSTVLNLIPSLIVRPESAKLLVYNHQNANSTMVSWKTQIQQKDFAHTNLSTTKKGKLSRIAKVEIKSHASRIRSAI